MEVVWNKFRPSFDVASSKVDFAGEEPSKGLRILLQPRPEREEVPTGAEVELEGLLAELPSSEFELEMEAGLRAAGLAEPPM